MSVVKILYASMSRFVIVVSRLSPLKIAFFWTFCALLVFRGFAIAISDDNEQAISNEIIASHRNFQDKFFPSVLSIDITRQDDPQAPIRNVSFVLKQIDEYFRLGQLSYTVDSKKETDVYAKNDRYHFYIHSNLSNELWEIKELGLLSDSYKRLEVLFSDMFYPIIVNDIIRIEDLLVMKDAIIRVNAQGKEQDANKLTTVDIELPQDRKRPDNTKIDFNRVLLSFNIDKHGWMPVQIEIFYPSDNRRVLRRDNFVEYGGFSVPTTVSWQSYLSNGNLGEKCDIKYHIENDTEAVSKDEFYLSHYGLPEPDFGERDVSWLRYILMTVGGLLVVYALWRMYRERKEKQQ